MNEWGDEEVETGHEEVGQEEPADPGKRDVDITTMTTKEFMDLSDWQFQRVLAQIMGELNVVQRKRTELAPYYYEYKSLQEYERNLSAQKSACQSILRTAREA